MARHPLLRFAVLLAALAFLLPSAAGVEACVDCLDEASPDCCPPSCCSCCIHSPSVLAALVRIAPHPAPVDLAQLPQKDPSLSLHPRDIFHVPKSYLV
jgi:hypothetical protein